MDIPQQPFGQQVNSESLIEDLQFFDAWEERYRFIIDLGKQLVSMPDELKTADSLVRGCQSQVWLVPVFDGDKLHFWVDSDAFIVKGLLALVLSAYNQHSPSAILAFDIDSYFSEIDLISHLSPTRGNGLRAVVKRIREVAEKPQETFM